MEKFTEWRDQGTGISPFMPVITHDRSNIVVKLVKNLFKALLVLVRLPFLLVAFAAYIIVPLGAIRKYFIWFILNFLFSSNFGVSSPLDLSIEGIKRSNHKLISANLPHSKDLIVVNYTSSLDGFILYLLNPNSVFLIVKENGSLIEYSLFQFFNVTFFSSTAIDPTCTETIGVKLENYKNKTIYLFPESTPSNGKSILPYPASNNNQNSFFLSDFANAFKFKVLTIRVLPADFTTPIPYLSYASYWFLLLSHLGKLKFKIRIALLDSALKDELAWDNVRSKSAEVGRLKLVGKELGPESKRNFVEAYKANRK